MRGEGDLIGVERTGGDLLTASDLLYEPVIEAQPVAGLARGDEARATKTHEIRSRVAAAAPREHERLGRGAHRVVPEDVLERAHKDALAVGAAPMQDKEHLLAVWPVRR